jgi:ubiquinone biosynthesis protein UbiJ
VALAILAHGFARPVAAGAVDTAQIERRVEAQVSARLDAAIAKAVGDVQARQASEFAKVLNDTEHRYEAQRQSDLASFLQADEYRQKQLARLEVASNQGFGQ